MNASSSGVSGAGGEGYVVIRNLLEPDVVLAPITHEHYAILDELGGSTPAAASVGERLLALARDGIEVSQHFDISLPQSGITVDTPIHTGPAVFALLTDATLLDAVESLIGPEIYSCPVQHTRIKLPVDALGPEVNSLSGTVPFHQDNGVLLEDADESDILTVWMPMTEATVANGCLRVLPRSHRRRALFDHCPDGPGGLAIPEHLLDSAQAVPLPMQPGDVLLMHRRTVHGSLDNRTAADVRISLDLRYQPIGTNRPGGRRSTTPASSPAAADRPMSSATGASGPDGGRCSANDWRRGPSRDSTGGRPTRRSAPDRARLAAAM